MMTAKIRLLIPILILTILVTACGGDDDKNRPPTATTEPTIYAGTKLAKSSVGQITVVGLTVIRSGPGPEFDRENITSGIFDILDFDASGDYYEIDYNGELRWVAVSSVNIDVAGDSSVAAAHNPGSTRVASSTPTATITSTPADRWGIAVIQSPDNQTSRWLNMLPSEWQNPSIENALYGLIVTSSEEVAGRCNLDGHRITRYQIVITVEVTDIVSGERLGIRAFSGSQPTECNHISATTVGSNRVTGNLPPDDEIVIWFASFTTGQSYQAIAIAPTSTITATFTPSMTFTPSPTYTPSLTRTPTATTPPEDRWGVFFRDYTYTGHEWKSVIPSSWLNDDLNSARYEIELTRTDTIIETCPYINEFNYELAYIDRVLVTVEVSLTDLATSQRLSSARLRGSNPETCQYREQFEYSNFRTLHGDFPTVQQFEEWLNQNMREGSDSFAILTPILIVSDGQVSAFSSPRATVAYDSIPAGTYNIIDVNESDDFVAIRYNSRTLWIYIDSENIEIKGDLSTLFDD